MKTIKKIAVPIFYVIMLVIILFMGAKIIAGKNDFKLTKEEVNLALDNTYQISIDADTRKQRETSRYSFTSKDPNIATVSETGLVTPKASGSTEIVVKRGRKQAILKVNVTDIPMDSVELSNNNIVINVGERYNLADLIKKSSYSYNYSFISSADSIVTVDNNGIAQGVAPGRAVVTITTNNGVNADVNITVLSKESEATSISIDNKSLNIKVGSSTQLNAYVYPDDASNKSVSWSSSNTEIVTVNSSGVITAISKGTATITASTSNGLTDSATVTVIANTTPTNPTNPNPPTSDGTEVTGIKLNTNNISVTVGGTVKVEYTVLPATATNKNVVWSVDNKDIITVYRDGRIVGKKAGVARATVKTYNNKTATVVVTVSNNVINPTAVSLNISSKSIYVGDSFNLIATVSPSNATNKQITWSSSNNKVASVNNGRVTGIGAGTATITAKTSNGKTATAKITVTKKTINPTSITLNTSSLTIGEGKSSTLVATVLPANANNKTVTWSSSNNSIATVTNGKVTGKKAGNTIITAKTSNGLTATAKVTVTKNSVPVTGVSLNKSSISLVEGNSETLVATITPSNATDKSLIWISSNTNIATVTNGKVLAKKAGNAVITVKTGNGKTATAKVTVKAKTVVPTSIKLDKTSGTLLSTRTTTLTATVLPANANNKTVTWSSSDKSVATVNSNGKITGKKAGTATITAKTSNGKTATYKVTVKKINIVMIGNSKTHTSNGSVYTTFVNVMANAGFSANIKRSTVGGTSLVEHARGKCVNTCDTAKKNEDLKNAKKVITDSKYDAAILQERTIAIYNGNYYKTGASEVKNLLVKNNSNIKIYLRQSWYYRDYFSGGKSSAQEKANSNASSIAKSLNMTVINDGSAFLQYHKDTKDTKIFRDNTHGTYEGVYLAAVCIYKKVTGQDPTKLTYYGEGGVTKARAQKFQKIAKSVC